MVDNREQSLIFRTKSLVILLVAELMFRTATSIGLNNFYETAVISLVIGISQFLIIASMIIIKRQQMLGILTFLLSELAYMIPSASTLGYEKTDSVVLLILVIAILREVYSEVCYFKDNNIKINVTNIVFFEKPVYETSMFTRVFVYSILLTATFALSNETNKYSTDTLVNLNNVVLPFALYISYITASSIIYEIYAMRIILRLETIMFAALYGEWFIDSFIICVIELSVVNIMNRISIYNVDYKPNMIKANKEISNMVKRLNVQV